LCNEKLINRAVKSILFVVFISSILISVNGTCNTEEFTQNDNHQFSFKYNRTLKPDYVIAFEKAIINWQ